MTLKPTFKYGVHTITPMLDEDEMFFCEVDNGWDTPLEASEDNAIATAKRMLDEGTY